MQKLMIDLETKSDIDIAKSGVYRYADSPYFDILLFAYSVDDAPVQVVDLASGEQLPEEIMNALTDDRIQKHAFNASFERICLSVWLHRNYPECFVSYGSPEDACGNYLSPNAWRCTMVAAAYLGLPLSLAGVGAVLQLQQQKMSEGKALIRHFCIPYDHVNGVPQFHAPTDAPEKWNIFRAYNQRDVETEQAIEQKIARFPVPEFVWQEYVLDQSINDRGIQLDLQLVQQAIRMDTLTKDKLLHQLKDLTNLDNPNSVQQMKQWLAEHGLELESLGKKEVQEQLKTAPPDLQVVLLLRQQASKSSVKKYQAMQNAVCSDGRARGMFQFYGANRTGREAGRIIQLQNLPQNHLPDLEDARELVKSGDLEAVELLYEDVPNTLSQLIRTAFVPKPGYKFLVADFSAIEARVIAWLAGEEWRMKAFANGEDIYCASASKMFGVPVVKHGENGHLRQKGKISELACGFGGSVGAMKAMGADSLGLSDTELKQIVTDWREASPHITEFWWAVDRAVKKAVKEKTATKTHGLLFSYEAGFLFIRLPSGRRLAYAKPYIGKNKFGGESVTYMGINAQKKWDRLESYGPKFVENCVQGIARDLLMYSMQTLSQYFIVGHIHDEMIIECPKDTKLDEICQQMARTPDWAKGLLLRADGYECSFYKKD
ncbi:DNA polymerase [Ruminococcus callidus]|uniref:DNA polymerase n=1 Tax=Ruminococcus callidus TaxID=40519 RepID=UPI001D003245|nr:DNA polymerase [Ruminococcus callidus]MCB5776547.1 DNA polymerase [Ruminococcus callidus]MCC2760229.1 DNA polymerase [Ruminococcus callidus]